MTKLIDPAQGESDRAKRKEARLKAWKRKGKKADREKERADRIANAKEVYGDGTSISK